MTIAQAESAMAGDLRAFHEALDREERILAARIATDEYGLVLRVAINEQDLDFDVLSRRHEDDASGVEASYLMRLGVSRIVKLSLEAHARFIAPTLRAFSDWGCRRKLLLITFFSSFSVVSTGLEVSAIMGFQNSLTGRLGGER
ncbi:hypothetical protein HNR00_003060 [Methylorubrum rhodinum]|uniref:Uncharacterized protein n=1 Tax=Methylorubrum rhodinum TaxID=29428 RepID=A0A840ZLZ7_9HYPH|nr:hypothetical protein [Methylorubrum rhodinum]MBB5758340.1 hypothetical protein [Methylorubrum rhodinum]